MNNPLTPQELRVLVLICDDLGNKQIADRMGINVKTVEKHRQAIYCKAGVCTTVGAVRWALRHGVVAFEQWVMGGQYRPRLTAVQRKEVGHRAAPTLS